jgi:phage shock protein PspC (stress-responsive transcriptional regulator)
MPMMTVMTTEPAPRRLYKEPEEKKLTGVCGGLGDYLGVDPTIVRIAVVVLAVSTKIGVLAYIIAALVIPSRPPDVPRVRAPERVLPDAGNAALVLGLVAVVAIGLIHEPFWFDGPAIGLILLGIGAWLLFAHQQPAPGARIATDTSTAGRAGATTLPGGVASPLGEPAPPEDAPPVLDDAPSNDPQGEVPPPVSPWGLGSTGPLDPPPPPPTPERGNGRAWAIVMAVICLVGGVVALLQVVGAIDLAFSTTVAGLLLAVGAAMVVGAWWRRGRWLVLLGLPLIALLLTDDVMDVPLDAGTGDRTVVVDLAHLRRSELQLTAGQLTVDLRDVEPAPGEVPTITSEVGLGQLVVIIPSDMVADVDARASVGDVKADDRPDDDGGVNVRRRFTMEDRHGSGSGGRERPRKHVDLDLRVGMGEVEVRFG